MTNAVSTLIYFIQIYNTKFTNIALYAKLKKIFNYILLCRVEDYMARY